MIFGYARVSTDAQDLSAQLKDLKAAGCERVFKEKLTGATADRPQLKKLLAAAGHGDVVIVAAVDRLSRDTTDLLVIARDLQKAGAGLRSLAEPVVDTTSDFAELVLAMLGVAAKLERQRIKERTAILIRHHVNPMTDAQKKDLDEALRKVQIAQPPISPPPLDAGIPAAGRVKRGHDQDPGGVSAGETEPSRLDGEDSLRVGLHDA